ncbi:alpha/beta hydrolase [Aquimarina sp. ERC-38]|uniref:alpha/beta hydrolase family protein n=1 Tax=Aquimarina sp. ERC-38 TaxID=2949996 RepID=UPI00224734A6|nr:alpha/beta fold hydrolase [Aquimarina sp. ERC-38]UZO80604.1 alpha/beta hydrolase [Aquimarina sp. ERC-38]
MIKIQLFLHFIFTLVITHTISSQSMIGVWKGNLKTPAGELPLILKVTEEGNETKTVLISPKQSPAEIPTLLKQHKSDSVTITVRSLNIIYKGRLQNDRMEGVFKQSEYTTPLTFIKTNAQIAKPSPRKQDPKPPYPYISEQITFTNKNAGNIELSGTLTLPKEVKNPPVVILISGSGPQDRNEEILNHRPFLILADHLTRRGIAVLRYDDRGTAKSEGVFKGAITSDFASDVEAAVSFLTNRKDLSVSKIGLIGHSEGGLIAPMVASTNKEIKFIVLLAGPGVNGKEIIKSQTRKSQELAGTPESFISTNDQFMEIVLSEIIAEEDPVQTVQRIKNRTEAYHATLDTVLQSQIPLQLIEKQAKQLANDPWMRNFLKSEPKNYLSQIKIPVLVLNGSKDIQVIPELNLPAIKNILESSGNTDHTIKELEGLNHLFQKSETGATSEYGTNEETFNKEALQLISDWVLEKSR